MGDAAVAAIAGAAAIALTNEEAKKKVSAGDAEGALEEAGTGPIEGLCMLATWLIIYTLDY